MAITGISAISGEQIIAAGAVSAKEAGKASFTTGGNDIQNLYDTVYTNSASWAGGGADYSAGKNISIAGDVISTTDTISVTGDVQVENSTETEVTSKEGTVWGTNYYGHYASLNSSYKITVSGTPSNLGVYVYDFDHGGYYVNDLTTADLQNFTISGLSSLPNAVTSKQGNWSTTEWFEGAEFGINDRTYNPESDPGMPAWPVSSTLYSLEGSNISLSGLNNFIETNSASWTASGPSYTGDAQGALDEVYTNSANWNSAAAMNELPVSAGEGMDIQNVDGNIVFSCTGGSVPEGVLVESGLEYNAVNEISGYSGSAFAQYGAEKQWLQHDDTLLHVANSAQYALGVNVSAVASLMPAPTILSTGTCDLNTDVFSGTSYVYWWKLSNGICRIKGWLRPNPANTPNTWKASSFASGAPSAMFNNTIIPTVIDFGGWADFIHWNEDGTLVFYTREVKLSAATQLVNFEFYGYYKEV